MIFFSHDNEYSSKRVFLRENQFELEISNARTKLKDDVETRSFACRDFGAQVKWP